MANDGTTPASVNLATGDPSSVSLQTQETASSSTTSQLERWWSDSLERGKQAALTGSNYSSRGAGITRTPNNNAITLMPDLADINITSTVARLEDSSTYFSVLPSGDSPEAVITKKEVEAAIQYRNSFKSGAPLAEYTKFYQEIQSKYFGSGGFLNSYDSLSNDSILYWIKKYFALPELSKFVSNTNAFLRQSWSTSTYNQIHLKFILQRYQADTRSFFHSFSDSIGLLANSKYMQADSTAPMFDVTQQNYGVPIPFTANMENKIGPTARNLMHDLSKYTTASMRRNLMGVAYYNAAYTQNFKVSSRVPHACNLVNDVAFFVEAAKEAQSRERIIKGIFSNFSGKLFTFIQYISNIGNRCALNLRDVYAPIDGYDRDFVVTPGTTDIAVDSLDNAAIDRQISEINQFALADAAIIRNLYSGTKAAGPDPDANLKFADKQLVFRGTSWDVTYKQEGNVITASATITPPVIGEAFASNFQQSSVTPGVQLPPIDGATADPFAPEFNVPPAEVGDIFGGVTVVDETIVEVPLPAPEGQKFIGYSGGNRNKDTTEYTGQVVGQTGQHIDFRVFNTSTGEYQEPSSSDLAKFYVNGKQFTEFVYAPSSGPNDKPRKILRPDADYGDRDLPGGSRNHKGYDIPAVHNSEIYTDRVDAKVEFSTVGTYGGQLRVVDPSTPNLQYQINHASSQNRTIYPTGVEDTQQYIALTPTPPTATPPVNQIPTATAGALNPVPTPAPTQEQFDANVSVQAAAATIPSPQVDGSSATPQQMSSAISYAAAASTRSYSNAQRAVPFSFLIRSEDVDGEEVFQEVDFLLKKITPDNFDGYKMIDTLRAGFIASEIISGQNTGERGQSYDELKTQLLASLSQLDLRDVVGGNADLILETFGIDSNGSSDYNSISKQLKSVLTQKKLTSKHLSQGFESLLGAAANRLPTNVLSQLTTAQTVYDSFASQLNTTGGGELLPYTDDIIDFINPFSYIDINISGIIPSVSLGSLQDIVDIASNLATSGPPTSISGAIDLIKSIKNVICEFELPFISWPVIDQLIKLKFKPKDIGRAIKDEFEKFVTRITQLFDPKRIYKQIEVAVKQYFERLFKELFVCDENKRQNKSGQENTPV